MEMVKDGEDSQADDDGNLSWSSHVGMSESGNMSDQTDDRLVSLLSSTPKRKRTRRRKRVKSEEG